MMTSERLFPVATRSAGNSRRSRATRDAMLAASGVRGGISSEISRVPPVMMTPPGVRGGISPEISPKMSSSAECGRSTGRGNRSERGAMMVELVAIVPIITLVAIIIIQGLVLASGVAAMDVAAKDIARSNMDHCYVPKGYPDPKKIAEAVLPNYVHYKSIKSSNGGSRIQLNAKMEIGFGSFKTTFDVSRYAEMPEVDNTCRR